MNVPEFKYEPIEVRLKRKIDLQELTPRKNYLRLKLFGGMFIGFAIVMAVVFFIAWLSQKYDF